MAAKGFRIYWGRISRQRSAGRPEVSVEVRALIKQMATANPYWGGAPRIHGELLLAKDTPAPRAVQPPELGAVVELPEVGPSSSIRAACRLAPSTCSASLLNNPPVMLVRRFLFRGDSASPPSERFTNRISFQNKMEQKLSTKAMVHNRIGFGEPQVMLLPREPRKLDLSC
jgi:hypothetical protein